MLVIYGEGGIFFKKEDVIVPKASPLPPYIFVTEANEPCERTQPPPGLRGSRAVQQTVKWCAGCSRSPSNLYMRKGKKKKTHCYSAGQSANLSVCRAAPLMRAGLFAPETLDNESATESSWSPLVSSGGRKWSEAKQPVAIILAIDRARSVLCLICLVCQVKGGPSSACGKPKSINKPPQLMRRPFPVRCPRAAIVLPTRQWESLFDPALPLQPYAR